MSEETKEDIVREMRMGSTGDMPCAYIVGMPDTIEEFPCGGKVPKINIKRVTVEELADRFEAAFKRELAGNSAAMREALEYVLQFDATDEAAEQDGLTDAERIAEYADHISECQKRARAALAAPPRNCDVGTAEEQINGGRNSA